MGITRMFSMLIGVVLTTAGLAVAPAGAVGPLSPPVVAVPSCGNAQGDAGIDVGGRVHGFVNCSGTATGSITYFRVTGSTSMHQVGPYTGTVLATAWDGGDIMYVVFLQGSHKWLGCVHDKAVSFCPKAILGQASQADHPRDSAAIVAAAGRWWAVWTEDTGPAGESIPTSLFQAHTLLGTGGRTRITVPAGDFGGDYDVAPSMAFAGGLITMVWDRTTWPAGDGPSKLRMGMTGGGGWTMWDFTAFGHHVLAPRIAAAGARTAVAWTTDGQVRVADTNGGSFSTHAFGAPAGWKPMVALTAGKIVAGWEGTTARTTLYERDTSGTWTGASQNPAPNDPIAVLGYNGKPKVVYRNATALLVRSEL